MKRTFIFLAMLGLTVPSWAAEYLVKYKDASALIFQAQQRSSMFRITDQHETGSYLKIDVKKENEVAVLAALIQRNDVEYVVPNAKVYAFENPVQGTNPLPGTALPVQSTALKDQWAIAKVQAEKAWQRAGNKGSKNVIVAVIDTGVDYRHKNLAPNVVAGYDFKENDSDPMDKTGSQNPGHGTHCAGIVGATGMIDGGITGLSATVSIMPIRFLGEDGSGDLNNAIKSIDYAIEKGAHVISASWGAAIPRAQAGPLLEAIKRADDKGIIFVAAAANDGKNNDTRDVFPANAGFPNTISVAASGSSDAKPSWSNFGKATVHLASPGEGIMSTLPGDKYGNLSGTSMATPLVSGMVALLKAQDPSLTGAQVRALLQTTGAKVSIETACNCRIDAYAAVDHLLNKKMWAVPAAGSLSENGTLALAVMNGQGPLKFESTNSAVLSVDAQGQVKALAKGAAQIKVTDSKGQMVSSLDFNVGKSGGGGTPPPTQPPASGCPEEYKPVCEILCGIQPDLPICQGNI